MTNGRVARGRTRYRWLGSSALAAGLGVSVAAVAPLSLCVPSVGGPPMWLIVGSFSAGIGLEAMAIIIALPAHHDWRAKLIISFAAILLLFLAAVLVGVPA
jgi:hypothetical protein